MFSAVPQIARNRWLFVLLGLICVVTGILAIVWPGIMLLTLGILAWPELGLATVAVFFAIDMLVRGIFTIVMGFWLRSLRHEQPAPVHTANLAT